MHDFSHHFRRLAGVAVLLLPHRMRRQSRPRTCHRPVGHCPQFMTHASGGQLFGTDGFSLYYPREGNAIRYGSSPLRLCSISAICTAESK